MTRYECEKQMLRLLKRAEKVFRAYSPEGEGFSMSCVGRHLEIIGFGGTLAVTRFEDGEVWRWRERT